MQNKDLILKLKKRFGLIYKEEYFETKIKEIGSNYFSLTEAIKEDIKKDWDNQKIDWLIDYINSNICDGLLAEINYNQINRLVNLLKRYEIRINYGIFLILMDSCPILEDIFSSILPYKEFYTEVDIQDFKGSYDTRKILIYYCHYLHKWQGHTMKRQNLNLGVKEIRLLSKEKLPILTNEEERALLIKAHDGDEEARQILINKNMPLVISIVNKFLGQQVEFNELVQEGMIALIEAIDNFDLTYNNKLSSYAYVCITKRIEATILNNYSLVYIPRNLISKYAQFKYELSKNQDGTLTYKELETKLNINEDTLSGFIFASRPFIDYDNVEEVEKNLGSYDLEISLNEELKIIIENLPLKQKILIESIYGLNGKKESNCYKISESLGVSHQCINAKRNEIIQKIALMFYLLGYKVPSFSKFLTDIPSYQEFVEKNKLKQPFEINGQNKVNKYLWVAYNLDLIASRTVIYLSVYSDAQINEYLINLLNGKVSYFDIQSEFMKKVHKRTRRKSMLS